MTSLPIIKGIFNLDFVIAIFCASLLIYMLHEFKIDPIPPLAILSAIVEGIGY